MKFELEILEKKGTFYTVKAYEVSDHIRILYGNYNGTISEIKSKIEEETMKDAEIVSSPFLGWY